MKLDLDPMLTGCLTLIVCLGTAPASAATVAGEEAPAAAGNESPAEARQEPPSPPPGASHDPADEVGGGEANAGRVGFVERLYQRFYRLIWPAGRFEGSVSEAVARATERGQPETPALSLYVVDVTTGGAERWPRPIGATEPVVCPGDGSLWYRRGSSLVREAVALDDPRPAGEPQVLSGVSVRRLFACIRTEDAATVLLVEDADQGVRLLEWTAAGTSWRPMPNLSEEGSPDPREAAQMIGFFASLRPDGFQAFTRNGRLLGRRPGEDRLRILTREPLVFVGGPAWLGSSDLLLVTALAAE